MNPHDHPVSTDLSALAQARKATILADLQGELRSRRSRRSLARGATAAALLVATTTLVWVAQRPLPEAAGTGADSRASAPTESQQFLAESPAPVAAPKIHITYVQTDPAILDRLATKPARSRIEQISDDELLHAMQEAGRPAGLIRAHGKLTVIEQPTQSPLGGQSIRSRSVGEALSATL